MVNGGVYKMTTKTMMAPAKIREIGLEALTKALGPVGMVRFLQQFETGRGNYTNDRKHWLKGLNVKDIVCDIRKHKG